MADDNKENCVTQTPLEFLHPGECQGVVIFPFLFLSSDKKLRGEGFCTKCREKLNCYWSLQELMKRCPPPPPPAPPPTSGLDSDYALSFEERLTAEDKIIMGDVDKLFQEQQQ